MDTPRRKPNRLKDYDYSENGAYFITVCTKEKACLFWNVGASTARPDGMVTLSAAGKTVEAAILNIPKVYSCVSVDKYAVMPNHIHMLLSIQACDGRAMPAPTISVVVQQMKGHVSKQLGKSIWQKLFHDHVVRNEMDYQKIWQYIDTNPMRRKNDCFYCE